MSPLFAVSLSLGTGLGLALSHALAGIVSGLVVKLVSPGTPAPATPAIDLAVPAHLAGLEKLVPFLRALEAANGPLILKEAGFVSSLVKQYGGFAVVLNDAFDQILETRLAAGDAKLLMQVAQASGVDPRVLLDALEGKTAAAK